MDFVALAQECAPSISARTLAAVARVESSLNPYAIGVVDGVLKRQPKNLAEALATVRHLEAEGFNFSVGIVQVNRYNLPKYRLSYEQAFNPCANVAAGGQILSECYARALRRFGSEQQALKAAFSCYYSGNFTRGFKPDRPGEPSYVAKVVQHSATVRLENLKVLQPTPAIAGEAYPIAVLRVASTRKSGGTRSAISSRVIAQEPVVLDGLPAAGANSLLF